MSRKPSFANLRTAAAPAPALVGAPGTVVPAPTQPITLASRQERRQIAGFFSPEMSFAMHMLARR
jgi:hypothetical protein